MWAYVVYASLHSVGQGKKIESVQLLMLPGLGLRQCRIRSVNQVQRYDEIHPFVESQRKSRLARTGLLARQSIRHVEASNVDAHHAVSDRNVVAVSNVFTISNRARFLVELLRLFVDLRQCGHEVCPSVRVESDRLVRFRRGSDGHLVSRDNHHAILSVAKGEAHPFALVPNFFARRGVVIRLDQHQQLANKFIGRRSRFCALARRLLRSLVVRRHCFSSSYRCVLMSTGRVCSPFIGKSRLRKH